VPQIDWLPRVAGAADVAGPLSVDAAAVCGLAAGIPVAVGLGDGPAANLAAGAVGGQRLCVSLGTTIVVRLLVRGPVAPEAGLPFFVQCVAGAWCCVGVRFSGDPAAGYTPVGVPGMRLRPAELPAVLRPLLDTYGVTELRPAGGGGQAQALRELADVWRLPVRDTAAGDGTRGAALLARCMRDGTALQDALPELGDAVPVCATIAPRDPHTARRGGD
jgi:sugar (pentulose or hexulose) kinase